MKKIYVTAALLLAGTLMNAQAFWNQTYYVGAFPVTDNSTATDWTSGWANFDPENTSYGAATTTVSTDITANTTWSGIVLLMNKVYVKNGAELTIQPGTIIRGDKTSQGSLIITRGSKINAQGTASSPIIFTSNENVGSRAEGDWGGLVILGSGKNNQPGGVANIEGIAASSDTEFGGNNDADNSGILRYIRIEFAGIALQPNKEINGITFGSVGSGTQVDHIQVSFSGDDSFEWFGGTVDAKYLIAYRGLDDDFDTDFGFRGRIQFGLIVRDKDLSDAAGDSNSFESDNDATGSNAQPLTRAIFSNITIVGPKGNGSIALPVGEKFEKSLRIRRNSSISLFNSIMTGWEKGLSIEGASTEDNFTGDSAYFANNFLVNFNAGANVVTATSGFYNTFFASEHNDSTKTVSQVNWVNAFPALGNTPDMRLNSGSAAANAAAFTNTTFGAVVTITTGISENKSGSEFFGLYPNPANSMVTINAAGNYGKMSVSVFDITGKEVIGQSGESQTGVITISTETLFNGIYFVTVTTTNGKETVKLVVNH